MRNSIKKLIPLELQKFKKQYLFKNKNGFSSPPEFPDMSGYEI